MTSDLSQQLTSHESAFWSYGARLLAIYPQRPAAMSREAEAKQLERQIASPTNSYQRSTAPVTANPESCIQRVEAANG